MFRCFMLFCSLPLLLGTGMLRAQSFSGGDNNIGVGIGAGGYYRTYSRYTSVSPVLTINYDRGTNIKAGPGVIGIGGYFGYKSQGYSATYFYGTEDWRWTYLMFGVRGTYHWNSWHGNDKLDMYAGVTLGTRITSYSDRSVYNNTAFEATYRRTSRYPAAAHGGLFAGVRYYFAKGFGVYSELGADITFVQGGLCFQF